MLLTFLVVRTSAQNAPGSPYSYFGIGDIYTRGFGQQLMVGSSGIAERDPYTLNNTNPASYSSIDFPYTGLFETGFSAAWAGAQSDHKSSDADLPYLALGFKTGKKSGFSIGMRQYSNIHYAISGTTTFSGLQEEYNLLYKGSGGLTDIYFGFGRSLTDRLSLGIHGSYIFGQITHTQNVWELNPSNALIIKDFTFLRTVNMEVGAQYIIPLGKSDLTFGLTYSPSAGMRETRDVTIVNNLESDGYDTLVSDDLERRGYKLPHIFGIGIAYTLRDKVKFYADGTLQSWSMANLEGDDYQLTNSYRISTGLRRLADYSNYTFWQRTEFGFGLFTEKSYLEIDQEAILSFGATVGFDVPIRNNAKVRLIYENGTELAPSGSQFTDNYSRITLSVTLLEQWFRKVKYD